MRRAITLVILFRLYRWLSYNLPVASESRFCAGNRYLMDKLFKLIDATLEGERITIHPSALR